jgi:hypothetical protein
MCICIGCMTYISISSYFVFMLWLMQMIFSCFVIFPQSRLVVVCYRLCGLSMFIIISCFDKYSFCCFSFSYPILFLLY